MKTNVEQLRVNRKLITAAAVALLCALSGCSSRLARENILASTQTAYGMTIAQNAQTQVPELKLGYARAELFYVPSSKTLLYDSAGKSLGGELPEDQQAKGFDDPSLTPEVLADIAIASRAGREGTNVGAQFRVRQRLAVGKSAVQSDAASVLMASGDAQAAAILRGVTVSSFADQAEIKRALLKRQLEGQPQAEALKKEFEDTAAAEGIAVPAGTDLSDFIHNPEYATLRRLVAEKLGLVK